MKWYSIDEVRPELANKDVLDYAVGKQGPEAVLNWCEDFATPVLAWLSDGHGGLCQQPAAAYYTGEDWLSMETGVTLEEGQIVKWAYYPTLAEPQEEQEIPSGTYIPAPQLELVRRMISIYDGSRNANMREQYAAQLVGMLKIVYGINTAYFEGADR